MLMIIFKREGRGNAPPGSSCFVGPMICNQGLKSGVRRERAEDVIVIVNAGQEATQLWQAAALNHP